MEITKIGRGRRGTPLTEESKRKILQFMLLYEKTVDDLRKEMGVSYMQLYMPLTGRRRAGKESYQKIMKYVSREIDRTK